MDRDPRALSDEELMNLIMNKDSEAYSELVRRHTDRFYALSYRMLAEREGAEDVVQDSFLMLWNTPEKWDASKNAKFTTWFYRVVLNACLDQRKKVRYETPDEDFEAASTGMAQDEASELKKTKDEVEAFILELPETADRACSLFL